MNVELDSPDVGELNTLALALARSGYGPVVWVERTVTKDMRSSLEYCASTVWHSHNSAMLGNSIFKGVCEERKMRPQGPRQARPLRIRGMPRGANCRGDGEYHWVSCREGGLKRKGKSGASSRQAADSPVPRQQSPLCALLHTVITIYTTRLIIGKLLVILRAIFVFYINWEYRVRNVHLYTVAK